MRKADAQDWRALLTANGLPSPPEGKILTATYSMRNQDWWVRIEGKGWFWMDGREGVTAREWKPSRSGP